MLDMYPKVSDVIEYDSMNITLQEPFFKKSWKGETSKEFAKQFRRYSTAFRPLQSHKGPVINYRGWGGWWK
jgi:hypothetical protein